jgi:hypothetical protein
MYCIGQLGCDILQGTFKSSVSVCMYVCTYVHLYAHTHTHTHTHTQNTHQFCSTSGGYCRMMSGTSQGDTCTQDSDCNDLGMPKTTKLPCCNSFTNSINMYCSNYNNDLVEVRKNGAKATGYCKDTDCVDWKSGASTTSVSKFLPLIVIATLSLVYAI